MNKLTDQIQAEVNKVVLGKEDIVRKVLLAILAQGHVLLEEHSPHGIGNHAVILTECDEALELKIKTLLEALHFTGFSNFDIKVGDDPTDFRVFEIFNAFQR